MKGIIRENLGDSRYIVGVAVNAEPVGAILEALNQEYADVEQKLIEANGKLQAAQGPYDAKLAEINEAAAEYQICLNDFNLSACIETAEDVCQADYSACDAECDDIWSRIGQCDYDCQQARTACRERCKREREACLAKAAIACQEAQQAHVTACQGEWGTTIAALQAEALGLLGPVQEALQTIAILEAQKLSLARRTNELDGVQSRETQITTFRAQYDDELEIDAEVELARTPAGRTVITEIVAQELCLQDSRGLPAGHLYVNAALSPGAETWHPTWRTGTVKAILEEDDKLQVEVHPGTLTGSLYTIDTVDPILCAPPQAYFDGNWQAAEETIREAREALTAAQEARGEAAQALADCLEEYDQTWENICYTDGCADCDVLVAGYLEACAETGSETCLEQAEAYREACYLTALNDCAAARQAAMDDCQEEHQPAIDAAQETVDAASSDLHSAYIARYQPASPLVLELPVEHCVAAAYRVEDDVLIDFPVRVASTDNPMAVWESGRVIGWGQNTRVCCCGGFSLLIDSGLPAHWLISKTARRLVAGQYIWEFVPFEPKDIFVCDPEENALKLTLAHDVGGADWVRYSFEPYYSGGAPAEFEIKINAPTGSDCTDTLSIFSLVVAGTLPAGTLHPTLPTGFSAMGSISAIDWTRVRGLYYQQFPRFGVDVKQAGTTVEILLRAGLGQSPAFCEPAPHGDPAINAAYVECRAAAEELPEEDQAAAIEACETAREAGYKAAIKAAWDAYNAARAANYPVLLACLEAARQIEGNYDRGVAEQACRDAYQAANLSAYEEFYSYLNPLPFDDLSYPCVEDGMVLFGQFWCADDPELTRCNT